ncbi:hypothetical protein [Spongiactinospora sp. 9N601]|uniref:hypothetical protein n=1 Tax=Spongiactinospora sp. 9N601 TaxID=3375149 RepID=UPI003793DDB9
MQAFVIKEIGRVGFMDEPVPPPGPRDAAVRTTTGPACARSAGRAWNALDDVVKVMIVFLRAPV